MKHARAALALTFVSAIYLHAIELSNEQLELSFDSQTGALVDMSSPAIKHQFIGTADNGYLWKASYKDTNGGTGSITSIAARSFHAEKQSATTQKLIWEDIKVPGAPDLRVEALVELDPKVPLSYWKLRIRNAGSIRFDEVRFPCVQNIAAQTNEMLAVPDWIGQVATNPRKLLNKNGAARELQYSYPGHTSMQCFAFYQHGGPGLYFACDDIYAFRKAFSFSGDGKEGANFSLIQLPENTGTNSGDYFQNYHAVLGTFTGDWFTAAEIYRPWATNQWWAKESRLKKTHTNSWAAATALWVWNRGRSKQVLEPATALQKKLQLPVSAMWHWWHGCAYDAGFPEYLPPREGEDSFRAALSKAHREDVHAIVYMNQRLWGMETTSWQTTPAREFAVLDRTGTIHPEVYNTFTKSPMASMCMGTEFWRNHYAGLTEQAFKLGVDGIYMDQACSSLACYNPAHGHAVGGGTYWMKGFQTMANDIRKRSWNITLAGEGVGESWLPYLDLMLSLQVSKDRYGGVDGWEAIPFFQAVYHPYVIQYGNYSSLTMPPYDELWPKEFAPKEPLKLLDRKFSQQFHLEQARAFVWGQQPTIANFRTSQLQERPEEINYALQLAKLRSRSLKWLLHGTFLRPPPVNAPEQTIDISRLSIYAGQQGGLTTYQKSVPQVLASAWSAEDKTVGIVLASISNTSLALNVNVSGLEDKLPKRFTIYRITSNGRSKIGNGTQQQKFINVKLSPREACVLEIVPR